MSKKNLEYFKTLTSQEILKSIKEDKGNAFININNNEFENKNVIGIKDIHVQEFLPTTVGSKILQDYNSPYTSTVVELLQEAKYEIVGTLNLDEFAMGFSNDRSFFGPVDNALNKDYVPGGSSGGSAYAVAKGLIPVATGTDTGGSIRQPAAFNGIYGMKPTYGLISRYGTVPFASSFDTIGILSNTIEDNIKTLEVLAKNDKKDLTNYVPKDYSASNLLDSDEKLTVGYVKEWMDFIDDQKMIEAIKKQIQILKSKGYEVKEVSLPSSIYSFELYMVLAYSEASANLSRYDGIKYGMLNDTDKFSKYRANLGEEVKKRLVIGAYMTSKKHTGEYYEQASKIRRKITNEFLEAFKTCDVLIGPITLEEGIKRGEALDSKTGYLNDVFAISANLAGIPAMSVPVGEGKDNLKIGMQILANKYEENKIYNIAKKLEEWGKDE